MGTEPGEAVMVVPPEGAPGFAEAPVLVDYSGCENRPTVLLDGLDEIYALAVTEHNLYAATYVGVLNSGVDGGTSGVIVDQFVEVILADDQALYWTDGTDLHAQGPDGVYTVFLPSHGTIGGFSQDADAVYALADGYLVRVDKATRAVQPLAEQTNEAILHWSGTVVDADHVYFVTYTEQGVVNLERIGKDGSGRDLVATNVAGLMEVLTLLIDDEYVYMGSTFGAISRVRKTGGTVEPLVLVDNFTGRDPPMAADAECLYYVSGDKVLCFSKADRSIKRVATVTEGRLSALAMHGTDLYIGAGNTGAAFDLNGWIGRVSCMPER